MRKGVDMDSIELELSRAIFIIEKELGVYIDEEYPLMKFNNQFENLKWFKEEEAKAYKKQGKGRGLR